MGRINYGRVLVGGLVAGTIVSAGEHLLNAVLLAPEWAAARQARGLGDEPSSAVGAYVLFSFLVGMTGAWLYAAIRPRFDATAETAMTAGTVVWLLTSVTYALTNAASGVFPEELVWFGVAWRLIEIPVAVLVGAWIYREDETRAPEPRVSRPWSTIPQ